MHLGRNRRWVPLTYVGLFSTTVRFLPLAIVVPAFLPFHQAGYLDYTYTDQIEL